MHLMDFPQNAANARSSVYDGHAMRVNANFKSTTSTQTSSHTREITIETESALAAATKACRQKTSENTAAMNVAITATLNSRMKHGASTLNPADARRSSAQIACRSTRNLKSIYDSQALGNVNVRQQAHGNRITLKTSDVIFSSHK